MNSSVFQIPHKTLEDYRAAAARRARQNEPLRQLAERADRDFSAIAGYAHLTRYRKLRLFAELLRAKRHFESREMIKAIPKNSAATALLDNVAQSIGKIAKFGDVALGTPETERDKARPATAQGAKAFRLLEEAGEHWAQLKCKAGANLPRGFLEIWEPAPGFTRHGSASFVEEFLRAARIMEAIIAVAGKPVAKTGIEGLPVIFENRPAR